MRKQLYEDKYGNKQDQLVAREDILEIFELLEKEITPLRDVFTDGVIWGLRIWKSSTNLSQLYIDEGIFLSKGNLIHTSNHKIDISDKDDGDYYVYVDSVEEIVERESPNDAKLLQDDKYHRHTEYSAKFIITKTTQSNLIFLGSFKIKDGSITNVYCERKKRLKLKCINNFIYPDELLNNGQDMDKLWSAKFTQLYIKYMVIERLRQEIEALEQNTEQRIEALRQDINQRINKVAYVLDQKINILKQEIDTLEWKIENLENKIPLKVTLFQNDYESWVVEKDDNNIVNSINFDYEKSKIEIKFNESNIPSDVYNVFVDCKSTKNEMHHIYFGKEKFGINEYYQYYRVTPFYKDGFIVFGEHCFVRNRTEEGPIINGVPTTITYTVVEKAKYNKIYLRVYID